jgi:hypothetical protein
MRRQYNSPVERDQDLEDQLTPALSTRLHKQSTFRKSAKSDRRKAEPFRKRTNLGYGAIIVARQKHHSSATIYGRILVQDGGGQMVEALNRSCASEGLRDDLGRRLSSQFLRRHTVGICHIDDGLSLPAGQRLRDILVRFESNGQKDDVRLDCFRLRRFALADAEEPPSSRKRAMADHCITRTRSSPCRQAVGICGRHMQIDLSNVGG